MVRVRVRVRVRVVRVRVMVTVMVRVRVSVKVKVKVRVRVNSRTWISYNCCISSGDRPGQGYGTWLGLQARYGTW